MITEKVCTKCKTAKPLAAFNGNWGTRDGLSCQCRSCRALGRKKRAEAFPLENARKCREWALKHPQHAKDYYSKNRSSLLVKARAGNLLRKFGLTPAQFDEKLGQQGGKCAACGEIPSDSRRPHVDHDHRTGKIRGVLCHGCNVALGMLRDNVDIILKLAEYRKSH